MFTNKIGKARSTKTTVDSRYLLLLLLLITYQLLYLQKNSTQLLGNCLYFYELNAKSQLGENHPQLTQALSLTHSQTSNHFAYPYPALLDNPLNLMTWWIESFAPWRKFHHNNKGNPQYSKGIIGTTSSHCIFYDA